MQERLDFALRAVHWLIERVYLQCFSDEVWAHGSVFTQEWVTAKLNGSDRYDPACLQHKYGKQPA